MTTKELRAEMKAIDASITVSGLDGEFVIRFGSSSFLDPVRSACARLDLYITATDVEGGRYNWSYKLTVVEREID